MNKKKIQKNLSLTLIITLLFTLYGCGDKNSVATTNTSPTAETTVAEQLSPSMSRYQEAATQNIILLAQKQHLNLAIQYYNNMEMSNSADEAATMRLNWGTFKSRDSPILHIWGYGGVCSTHQKP